MKRSTKRLRVASETVRVLGETALAGVGGGGSLLVHCNTNWCSSVPCPKPESA